MENDNDPPVLRTIAGTASVAGLVCIFIFQQFNFSEAFHLGIGSPYQFFINRTFRFFLNDALAIVLIWALFSSRNYVLFSIWVQLFGLFFVLLPYFAFKIYFPSYNGPLLSFMHRLILNPTLLLLLIPALYYQKRLSKPDMRDNQT